MKATYYSAAILTALSCSAMADIQQDREAILKMAGEFKVGFFFKETVNLSEGYVPREKAFNESAHEKVVVVRDEEKEIELQHLLLVQGEVVKHWSQIWKYEDTELLEYQGHNTWKKRTLSADEVKGTWTQQVTQTTDAPRYESFGTWKHNEGSSTWTSELTSRPLPRREHKKRKDYDVLVATNRQTVNSEGWVHEQDNAKQVVRDGKNYPLCREVGFNTYTQVEKVDFNPVDTYWSENQEFWMSVKKAWNKVLVTKDAYVLKKRTDEGSLRFILGELEETQQKDVGVLSKALEPYFTSTK